MRLYHRRKSGLFRPTKATFTTTSSESAAFLARTSGLSDADKTRYDTLISTLVTNGIFAKLDCLYRFDAPNNQATSFLNLVSSSFTCTTPGTVTFTAGAGNAGTTFANSTIDTNFNPATAGGQYTQNSAHISVWNNTTRAASTGPDMSQPGAAVSDIYPRYTGDLTYGRVNDNTPSGGFATTTAVGNFLADRASSTARTFYRDAVDLGSLGSVTSAASASFTFQFLVDSGGTIRSGDQLRAGSIGGHLTAGEVSSFHTAMVAF